MKFNGTNRSRSSSWLFRGASVLILGALYIIISGCGKEKVVIREIIRDPVQTPAPIELAFPPADTIITTNNPTFYWNSDSEVIRYQLHVAGSSDFINKTIDVMTADTTYTTLSEIANGSYFWRVRGENEDSVRGDWSDAEIRPFYKSDYVNYIELISSINTVGTAQDVFVRGDTAYVADGQADLTIIDVIDRHSPFIIRNIDTISDDFAKSIYVAPADTFPFVFVADMDAHVQVINIADAVFPEYASFAQQNIEDIYGVNISDTLYIFTARSRGVSPANFGYYRIIYDPFPTNITQIYSMDLPADANGIFADSQYSYIAAGVAGLIIMDHSDILNPVQVSSLDLAGSALSVWAEGDYVYVAADRAGIFVVDVADRYNPGIATQVNTSGRTKDVHIVGDYAFIADASRGLKVIDISVPDSAHFIATYDTPYAYGLWADADYIYVCDRDEGLIIFENLSSR